MQIFSAPIAHARFLLRDVLDYDGRVASLPGYEDASCDLVLAALEEAGVLCSEVLLPLNRIGDEHGCSLADGVVTTPPGFAAAYERYVGGGWTALAGDSAYGGSGLPQTMRVALSEFVCAANLSLSSWMLLTEGAIHALHLYGSDDQRRRYLPPLISGEWAGTMCLTEPQAGSDLGLIVARATPEVEGRYVLDGTKIFITCGEHDLTDNIVHLVLAKLPDAPAGTKGISLFVVPKVLPDGSPNGVHCDALERKMGIHGSPTCVLRFEGARGELVGEPHGGMRAMFAMMNHARIGVGMQGLGVSETAYQTALAYARTREQGRTASGKRGSGPADPIVEHADVRRMLARMRCLNEAGRALAYDTAMELDRSLRHPDDGERARATDRVALLTPVVKALLTDNALEITSLGVQVHGGHGYIRETGAEQLLRDARITQLWEGTNGIQALDLVGRKLALGDGAVVAAYLEDLDDHCRAAADRDLARPVTHAVDDLRRSTETIRRGDPHLRAAAATDYLRAFGLVAFGVFWLRMADARSASPAARALARFGIARVLPEAASLARSLAAAADADVDAATLDT